MRLRFRFTVRVVMALVALAAVTAAGARWVWEMRERSRQYQFAATLHDLKGRAAAIVSQSTAFSPAKRAAEARAAEWHAKRRDLLREAARYPWRDVDKGYDPPPSTDPAPDGPAAAPGRFQRIPRKNPGLTPRGFSAPLDTARVEDAPGLEMDLGFVPAV